VEFLAVLCTVRWILAGLELYWAWRTMVVRPQPLLAASVWIAGYLALLGYAIFAGFRGDARGAINAGVTSGIVALYYYGSYRTKLSDVVTAHDFNALLQRLKTTPKDSA